MTKAFGYNPRSELTTALMDTNAYSYAYDGIGNRLTATNNGVGTIYLTNPLNQYTNLFVASAPPCEISPAYDRDGNMLTNGVWSYAWDGENRLITAYSNSLCIVSNAYDHQSRRVLKVTQTADHCFLYDGWNLVQETICNQQSTITNHYVWGLDLSASLQGAGGIGGLLAVIRDGEPFFPCYDANGNVTEYLSTNGTVVAHYEYDPFGNTVVQTGDMADAFAFRFSTKYHDPETGLVYYGYRYYAPWLGRWMNRDPIGEDGGANLVNAAHNNLVCQIDLLGRKVFVIKRPLTMFTKEWTSYLGEIGSGAGAMILGPVGLTGGIYLGQVAEFYRNSTWHCIVVVASKCSESLDKDGRLTTFDGVRPTDTWDFQADGSVNNPARDWKGGFKSLYYQGRRAIITVQSDDTKDAIVLAALTKESASQKYILGGSKSYNCCDWATKVLAQSGLTFDAMNPKPFGVAPVPWWVPDETIGRLIDAKNK